MKLSFGPPLPVGGTSACEFFDITLESIATPGLMEQFAGGLPEGMRIVKAHNVYGREESLAAAINRVEYEIPLSEWSDLRALSASVDTLLARPSLEIERESKQTIKRVDIRPAIHRIEILTDQLRLTLGLEEGRYARPTEILTLLGEGLRYPVAAVPLHRTRLYRESVDGIMTEGMQL